MPAPTRRVSARLTIRRGTASEWESANPVLLEGEPGYVTDSQTIKFGDGVTSFSSLENYSESAEFTHDASRFPVGVTTVYGALEYLHDHLLAGDLGAHGSEHVTLSTDLLTELGELLITQDGNSLQFEDHTHG